MHIKSKKSFLRKIDHLQQSLDIEKSKHCQVLYAEAPEPYIERLQHLNQRLDNTPLCIAKLKNSKDDRDGAKSMES